MLLFQEFCEYGPSFQACLPFILANCPQILSPETLSKVSAQTPAQVLPIAVSSVVGGDGSSVKEESVPSAASLAAAAVDAVNDDLKKKKVKGPKKSDVKVVIAKIHRQGRKYVTNIAGLESVPDVRLKDVAKLLGKKFSSGCSVQDTASGGKEVTIQVIITFLMCKVQFN